MNEKLTIQDMNKHQPGYELTRDELHDVLLYLPIGFIATQGAGGYPNIARVAFSVHEDLQLVVGTSAASRKAGNIALNPKVAFEAGSSEERYTVQLEGDARLLADDDFDEHYAAAHYDQLPASRPFRDQPGQVHIAITPVHMRFSDCMSQPWVLTDIDMTEQSGDA
jgi:general stress protein 26